jgi:hypothetical protein
VEALHVRDAVDPRVVKRGHAGEPVVGMDEIVRAQRFQCAPEVGDESFVVALDAAFGWPGGEVTED